MARYDKVLGEKDRIYYLFSWQDGSEYRNSNGFTPPAENGNMPGTVRTTMINTFDWTRVLNPSMVLDVRASYNPFSQNFPDVSDPGFTFDKVGIKNIPQVDTFPSRLMPRIIVDNFQEIFGNQHINQSSRKQLSFTAGLAHTKGRHGMKYGFEWATVMRGNYASGRSTGDLSFNRSWTQQYSGRNQGFADGSPVATLLLGLPTGGSIAYNDMFYRREPYLAWYFQDDWKLNSKLTLNLGLRYDLQFPLYEINNRLNAGFDFAGKNPVSDAVIANWQRNKAQWDAANPGNPYPVVPDAIRGGLLFAGVGGQPRRVYDWDLTNIQLRLGFAYNFLSKTVMRGGFGIFYRTATQGNLTNGFSQSTPYLTSLDGGLTPSSGGRFTGQYSLEDPWPQGVIRPAGADLGPGRSLTSTGRTCSASAESEIFRSAKGRRFSIENKVLNALAGGWNYNWIYMYYAGVPTPMPDARFKCASYVVPDQSSTKWFNNDRSCYEQRPAFTFREVPNRFAWIRDPHKPQLNMALVKRLQFNERWSMELRGESFNFTNTPTLKGPNTSFTDPLFDTLPIQQDNFARNIQLGARIRF